ncbi:S-locus glycoprotein [Parasponia andersonii]|uniref:S-locus glycoprotein n=1 Tax=Parasponia andersonii TaxID=3476 RepID=A0A2P5CS31_PARAD|nr:S-locus glycoprotein [Parasponia andersonii]
MEFLRILVFIAFVLARSEAQQRQSNISLGSSLTPDENSTWLSNSGLYAFGFYKEGNGFSVGIFLAGIREKTVVWTANRDSPPVTSNATLVFTSEGSLVLQSREGNKYIGDSALSSSSASMMDSGNFVLYNSNGRIIWQSFDHPTDTLLPTQRLLAEKQLISSASESDHASGIFMLAMQSDGNLVQYPVKSTPLTSSNAYYASDTYGNGGNVSLVFDSDAHLYLMNSSGVNIRNITNKGYYRKDTIFLMRIDWDGLFRLYSFSLNVNTNWTAEWASSNDRCDPQGLCGLNGFCTLIDQEADCKCLPGFDFVDKGNWTAGCERNFIADSCGNNNKSLRYTMEELPNTSWEEDTYSVLEILDKESCIQACLDDCNCEAAFY